MPHWVQIECEPNSAETSAVQLDLETINTVQILRTHGKPVKVSLIHSTSIGMDLKGLGMENFLKAFDAYQKANNLLQHVDEEATPGSILPVSDSGVTGSPILRP